METLTPVTARITHLADQLAPFRTILFAHFNGHDLIPKLELCDYLYAITLAGKELIIPDFRHPQLLNDYASSEGKWERGSSKLKDFFTDDMENIQLSDLHFAVRKTGFVAWLKNRYSGYQHSVAVPYAAFDEPLSAVNWLIRFGFTETQAALNLQKYARDILDTKEEHLLGSLMYALLAMPMASAPFVKSDHSNFQPPYRLSFEKSTAPFLASDDQRVLDALCEFVGAVLTSCHYPAQP